MKVCFSGLTLTRNPNPLKQLLFSWGLGFRVRVSSEKQTFISLKFKSLFSSSWSSCCPGSLKDQDDRTSRMGFYKPFFFGEIRKPSLSSAEVPAVPGFYKVSFLSVAILSQAVSSHRRHQRRRSTPTLAPRCPTREVPITVRAWAVAAPQPTPR